ncbi:MAG: DUF1559 domain-containing protein, partial [Blastopirellula sp. JB062]
GDPMRRGFTLVELLVVIAIIGVLIALLLPAVQQAREAVRRITCNNQIKQLGLALHNYHDTFLSFPPGNYGMSGSGRYDGANWRVQVLPFIEQSALHDQLDFTARFEGDNLAGNEILSELIVPGLLCPSSALEPFSNPHGRNDDQAMIIHYVGISGAAPSETQPLVGYVDCGYGWFANNGMLLTNQATRLRDATDGTSNTMLLAEQSGLIDGQELTANYRGGWHGASSKETVDTPSCSQVWFAGTTTVRYNPNYDIITSGNSYQYRHNTVLNSFHPGGVNILRTDGSTRFVSDTINLETLKRLAVRNDGELLEDY